jgi:pimeloyl-ACP methyl ester carboxylesterase
MLPIVLLALGLPAPGEVASALIQVGPAPMDARSLVRSPGQERAVVLIHGLTVHPSEERILRAEPHGWQKPDAAMARRLLHAADVFAFAYGQHTSITDVVERSDLRKYLGQLHEMGYREIVLVGHSAGGIIARQLVEDHPDVPVNRVVQVATPNLGSGWATFQLPWSVQKPFTTDLTKWIRKQTQSRRADILIPSHVEFVSVVANGILQQGDGLVIASSQWTPDLIAQRIPVHEVRTTHRGAVYDAEAVALIALLATTPQPRWPEAEIEAARRRILGK